MICYYLTILVMGDSHVTLISNYIINAAILLNVIHRPNLQKCCLLFLAHTVGLHLNFPGCSIPKLVHHCAVIYIAH